MRAEVAAYESRREARRLDRVFSRERIERGAAEGRVAPEAREGAAAPPVEEAVETAVTAFEDGIYLVAIDGVEVREVEARVSVRADTRVTFIRLVLLAGA